jgi:hypothetical protein
LRKKTGCFCLHRLLLRKSDSHGKLTIELNRESFALSKCIWQYAIEFESWLDFLIILFTGFGAISVATYNISELMDCGILHENPFQLHMVPAGLPTVSHFGVQYSI